MPVKLYRAPVRFARVIRAKPILSKYILSIWECTDDVNRWFLENKLLFNPSKTEAMLCGTQVQCNKVNTSGGVEVAGTAVKFGDFIKLLGVKLDPSISMNRHVTELVRNCNYHIRALRHIRPLLTLESTKMVALGIAAVRLDYCNSLQKL